MSWLLIPVLLVTALALGIASDAINTNIEANPWERGTIIAVLAFVGVVCLFLGTQDYRSNHVTWRTPCWISIGLGVSVVAVFQSIYFGRIYPDVKYAFYVPFAIVTLIALATLAAGVFAAVQYARQRERKGS